MTKSIGDIELEIIDEFNMFDDWMPKYEHIIELGRELPIIDESKKTENNLIKGCQSRVWLDSAFKDGRMEFTADSDAIITKGLVAIIIRVFNHQKPSDIIKAPLHFINNIGLTEHLSQTRANGLLSMVQTMKNEALKAESGKM
jgi:cysteine desulfuration protein SufE